MFNILDNGIKEDLGNGYYKILFNWPKPNQLKAYYPDRSGALGAECIARSRLLESIVQAKKDGYFIIVTGRSGWHTLYKPYIDEYYGVQEWGGKEMPDKNGFVTKRIGPCEINRGYKHYEWTFEFEKYDLPKPSNKALEIANEKLKAGKFVTVGAMKRDSFETRDFHDWLNLVQKLQAIGFKVYATCPRSGGVENLPCEHMEDFCGPVNLMDIEIAMHSLASACVCANTGVQGLMIYSNTDYIFSLKGDAGPHGCCWHDMHEALTKRPDYKTKFIQVSPTYGPDNLLTENILNIMKEKNITP